VNVAYDRKADAAYIRLGGSAEKEAVAFTYPCDPAEVNGQIHLDFDGEGRLIGIEVLDASRLLRDEVLVGARSVD
jgi:uncharacterized protein YuzE